MRGAALIFGLLAGLLGGVAIAFGTLQSGLADLPALGANADLLSRFIVYLVPNIGLLGAGIVLSRPRLGGIIMLLSALGWVAVAILADHGAVLYAALPFIFVCAGGLVALFARRPAPAVAPASAPSPRREPSQPPFAGMPSPTPAVVARPPQFEIEPQARRGAGTDRQRDLPGQRQRRPVEEEPYSPDVPAADHAAEPSDDDYPAPEDYVDAEEAYDEAPPEPYTDEAPEAEEAYYEPELPDEPEPPVEAEEPTEPYFEAPPTPRRPKPRRASNWSLPEPQDARPPRRVGYAAERQAQPERREPVEPLPMPPQPEPPVEDELDFELTPEDYAPVPPPPEPAQRQRRSGEQYRSFDPYDPDADASGGRTALRRFLGVMVLIVFLLVVAGIVAAVYFDYERGPDSLLFGTRHAPTASANVTEPQLPASAALPRTATPGTAVTDRSAPRFNPSTTAAPTAQPSAATTATPAPPAPTPIAAADTFTDPFKYCATVDTVDAPDSTYTGPAVPDAVAAGIGVPASNQVHWRCVNKVVFACDARHGPACDLTPTVESMVNYCASHPDAKNLPAPNGSWSCEGKRPVIPRNQRWPVDGRGFYPGAWKRISPPGAG